MLEIKELKSGYGKMEIIHGINFQIKPGEIVAIIGPNGCGKSTFLKSIFNLCDIYHGKIIFQEKDITMLPTYDLIQEGISFVNQGRQIFSDLTILENLEIGGFILDKKVKKINLEEVYKKFPFLEKRKNDYAKVLSGGQRQMLAIARALMQNPKLLLMDEPSLGLSPKAMKELFAKIIELNKEGISMIIVEQNAKKAIEIANRTYVFENGEIAFSGKDVLKNKKIQDIYLG